jgi:hypothetical protein
MQMQPNDDPVLATATAADDRLAEIDHITEEWRDDQQELVELNEHREALRLQFDEEFTCACEQRVRPAMERIIERLRRDGGDGLIVERPADTRFHHTHRLILWMSLSGEVGDAPRQDRHPYLQLDADVALQTVKISEGDMWQGHGGNSSGEVGKRPLSEVDANFVIDETVAILARSAGHPPNTK